MQTSMLCDSIIKTVMMCKYTIQTYCMNPHYKHTCCMSLNTCMLFHEYKHKGACLMSPQNKSKCCVYI